MISTQSVHLAAGGLDGERGRGDALRRGPRFRLAAQDPPRAFLRAARQLLPVQLRQLSLHAAHLHKYASQSFAMSRVVQKSKTSDVQI